MINIFMESLVALIFLRVMFPPDIRNYDHLI